MPSALPPLPFAIQDLMPYMSSETILFAHERVQAGHVQAVQEMTKHKAYKGYRGKSFDAIINQLQADPALKDKGFTESSDTLAKLYYHASQAWNMAFFWQSLSPKSAGGINTSQGADRIPPEVMQMIERDFGSYDKLKFEIFAHSEAVFGAGWLWLMQGQDGKLVICHTGMNDYPFDTPIRLMPEATPLLACNLWEHAYYLDYRNRRGDYVASFADNLANWKGVQRRLQSSR